MCFGFHTTSSLILRGCSIFILSKIDVSTIKFSEPKGIISLLIVRALALYKPSKDKDNFKIQIDLTAYSLILHHKSGQQ